MLVPLSFSQMLVLLFLGPPLIMMAGAFIGKKVQLKNLTTKKLLYKTRKWEQN